ncbi:hypothetical protein F4860DRAFT_50358 [Xylaria cubensis]|nr:hypothetical protein F4860DRAFT_50358 [Xylaria cubensis]
MFHPLYDVSAVVKNSVRKWIKILTLFTLLLESSARLARFDSAPCFSLPGAFSDHLSTLNEDIAELEVLVTVSPLPGSGLKETRGDDVELQRYIVGPYISEVLEFSQSSAEFGRTLPT